MRTLRVRGLAICRLTVWTTCCSQIDRADPEYLALIETYQINRAEAQFRSVKKRYGTLQELGPRGANLISRALATAQIAHIFSPCRQAIQLIHCVRDPSDGNSTPGGVSTPIRRVSYGRIELIAKQMRRASRCISAVCPAPAAKHLRESISEVKC